MVIEKGQRQQDSQIQLQQDDKSVNNNDCCSFQYKNEQNVTSTCRLHKTSNAIWTTTVHRRRWFLNDNKKKRSSKAKWLFSPLLHFVSFWKQYICGLISYRWWIVSYKKFVWNN